MKMQKTNETAHVRFRVADGPIKEPAALYKQIGSCQGELLIY